MAPIFSNIRAESARRGWSVLCFCEKIGIGRRTFYNWQTKDDIPSEYIPRIAGLFGLTTDELIGLQIKESS